MPELAGKDFAYILGVYLGDGCVTKTGRGELIFRLNTIDSDFAEAVRMALSKLTKIPVGVGKYEVKNSTRPNYDLRCRDPIICKKLIEDTQNKKIIPEYVLKMSRNSKRAFIAGVMDSEGYVAAKTDYPNIRKTGRGYYLGIKVTDEWIYSFAKLLQSMGVEIGKISPCPPNKPGYKTPVRFHIKIQSWADAGCYFKIRRKQERIEEWVATKPYTQRSLYPRGGPQRNCTVEGCGRKYLARGYCNFHYYRFIKSSITGRKGVR